MTVPVSSLLTSAEDWARDVLLDAHTPDPRYDPIQGWAHLVRTAATVWKALPNRIQAPRPFDHATLIVFHLTTSHSGPREARIDPRIRHVTDLLREIPQAVGASDSPSEASQQARTGIVHLGYLLTHATAVTVATRTQAASQHPDAAATDRRSAHHRILGVEQVLDAHLHQQPGQPATTPAVAQLEHALDKWLRAAYQASGQPPDPMTQLIIADTAANLIGNTAALSVQAARQGQLGEWDLQHRLLPALKHASQSWIDTRNLWSAMITPTTRQQPLQVQAATALQQAFRHPDLPGHPATPTIITTALAVNAEIALLNQQALTDPRLVAPVRTVANLTREVLTREPNGHARHRTWASMTRLEGHQPAPFPDIVRADLNNKGSITLQTALNARSAGHALTRKTSTSADKALHEGQTHTPKPHPDKRPPFNRPGHPDHGMPR